MDNSVHSTWKSKGQLSHILQTELPTIPKDSQLYTLPPMPTTTESPPIPYIFIIVNIEFVFYKCYNTPVQIR